MKDKKISRWVEGPIMIAVGLIALILSLQIRNNPVKVEGVLNLLVQAKMLPIVVSVLIVILGAHAATKQGSAGNAQDGQGDLAAGAGADRDDPRISHRGLLRWLFDHYISLLLCHAVISELEAEESCLLAGIVRGLHGSDSLSGAHDAASEFAAAAVRREIRGSFTICLGLSAGGYCHLFG